MENSETTVDTPSIPLSKNAQKRLLKEQKRKEMWKQKRQHEKEKRKEKKRKMQEEGILPAKETNEDQNNIKRRKKNRAESEIQYSGSVVIDCGFDSVMTPKEVRALGPQINYSCSSNSKAEYPFHLYCTSFGGQLESVIKANVGHERWKAKFEPKDYMQLFDPSTLVYLTSESPNVLQEVDPNKVYIIGGIVDHNRLKGITYQKAQSQGIATAQLPIEQHMKLSGRKVLTVNHVLDILLAYAELKDWKVAFEKVIPMRKKAASEDDEETSEKAAEEIIPLNTTKDSTSDQEQK